MSDPLEASSVEGVKMGLERFARVHGVLVSSVEYAHFAVSA